MRVRRAACSSGRGVDGFEVEAWSGVVGSVFVVGEGE